jgi:hypothetical protein
MNSFTDDLNLVSKPDRTQLSLYLKNILENMPLNDFVHLFTNEFQIIIDYYKLCNGEKTGQKITLLFNPHRMDTNSIENKISLYKKLKDPKFYSNLVRVLFMEKYDLYQTCALGVGGSPIIADFPPHVMRDYCIQFRLNKESKILDPCAGWGGRMIGASIICNNYTCFDPATETYNGLCKLYNWLHKLNYAFTAKIYKMPFEDSKLEKESFDFALTSPPYYNTEEYSDEESNSLNRYKTFDEWSNKFYIPMIKKTMRALKPKCTFVLNIGSRKYPLNIVLLDTFSSIYSISKLKGKLSSTNGLGKTGEGETFYAITKGE